LKVAAKALTFSTSIISYAGEQGAEKPLQTPFHNTLRHCEGVFHDCGNLLVYAKFPSSTLSLN
jgi:hypothetical protein